MPISEIQHAEVADLIAKGEGVLVEALPEEVYAEGHLPGAVNIRPRRVVELAKTLLPNLDERIVVYCGSAECDSSLRVAQRLVDLGYRDVHRYVGGKQDWVDEGRPIEIPVRPSLDSCC